MSSSVQTRAHVEMPTFLPFCGRLASADVHSTGISTCNAGEAGGVVFLTQSSLSITESLLSRGTALVGGGVVSESSVFQGSSTTISSHAAAHHGGGMVLVRSSAVLEDVAISDSTAGAADGGGVYMTLSTLDMVSGRVSRNSANGPGGGIFASDSTVTMNKLFIENNIASQGGGVAALRSDCATDECWFIQNVCVLHVCCSVRLLWTEHVSECLRNCMCVCVLTLQQRSIGLWWGNGRCRRKNCSCGKLHF